MTFARADFILKVIALTAVAIAMDLSHAEASISCRHAWRASFIQGIQFAAGKPTPSPKLENDLRQDGNYVAIRDAKSEDNTWVFVDRESMKETFRISSPADQILISDSHVGIQATKPKWRNDIEGAPRIPRNPRAWNIYRLSDGERVTSVFSREGEISLNGSVLRLENPNAIFLGTGKPREIKPVEIDLERIENE